MQRRDVEIEFVSKCVNLHFCQVQKRATERDTTCSVDIKNILNLFDEWFTAVRVRSSGVNSNHNEVVVCDCPVRCASKQQKVPRTNLADVDREPANVNNGQR